VTSAWKHLVIVATIFDVAVNFVVVAAGGDFNFNIFTDFMVTINFIGVVERASRPLRIN
jgi:hypothetical protein